MNNCLCEACIRHLDRRANCPLYKNRPLHGIVSRTGTSASNNENMNELEQASEDRDSNKEGSSGLKNTTCLVIGCDQLAAHLLRKKWLSMMSIKRVSLPLKLDYRNSEGKTHMPICDLHYKDISHMMICSLCKKKLFDNPIFLITRVSCFIYDCI